jgi:hypothetical protein
MVGMRALIAAALVLAVLSGAWWLARSQDPEVPPRTADARQAPDRPSAEAPVEPPAPATLPQTLVEPFRERLRTFVAGASGLSEAERVAEAEALRRDTLAREADGSLLPAESAYIQLALLRATLADEALLGRRSQALLERYETASEEGWEDYRRRSDPRHEAYREAEAELIRRAQVDNVSGDELRERLQALREQHYE